MLERNAGRRFWLWLLAVIVLSGLLSRAVETGLPVVDKYLGDALYAAMIYVLFRLTGRIRHAALWAAATITALELFQLTGIPAAMFRSGYPAARLCARLLGTQFALRDLLAYAAGIGCVAAACRLAGPGQ